MNNPPQIVRRLSIWRTLAAICLVFGLALAGLLAAERWTATRTEAASDPWFAPYVDVTSTPTYAFDQVRKTPYKDVVLSFIVAQPSNACTPTWGGAYTLDEAGVSLDLDRRIASLRQRGGDIAISFGGLLNDELAVVCQDTDKLTDAYRSVVKRYNIDTIDLDLENNGLTDTDAAVRRANAVAKLQSELRADGKQLAVWITVPVLPQGLTEDGTNMVATLLSRGVDIAGINIMTMNYGQSRPDSQSMFEASKSALLETHRQLGILYENAGIYLSDGTLWTKLGATPMIGQNDIQTEVFTEDDARKLNEYAKAQNVGRMSMWSANRDIQCGDNYVNVMIATDSCSGVQQNEYGYATILSSGFTGRISLNASSVTTSESSAPIDLDDDPATSPYQIWSENSTYLAGTKVVWKRNVYEAKWWTQGEHPDNPVLNAWETAWQLIGPVLPGEKPIELPKLPAGIYADWNGTKIYEANDRVLFEGVPYQAKWWNQGQSPAAAVANPDGSPWIVLTVDQINTILDQNESN